MERWFGKVAVVTGASSGIGAAIVKSFAQHGIHVVGIARRVEMVEDLAKEVASAPGKIYAYKADVAIEKELLAALNWTFEKLGPVHILVNNAGILASKGGLIDGETSLWKNVYDVNVIALCIATREVIQKMMANNIDGHIIHMNSIAGHFSGNGQSVYGASKFSVTNLTETLRLELNTYKSKIKVTSISPGVVETEILTKREAQADLWASLPKLKSEDIADACIYVLGTPPHVQIHELMIKPIGEPL